MACKWLTKFFTGSGKENKENSKLFKKYTRAINKENEWDALVHIYYDKEGFPCCHQIPFEADLKLNILLKKFYKDFLDITEFKLDTVDFKIDRQDFETETSLEEDIVSDPVFETDFGEKLPVKPILRQPNQKSAAKSLTWAPKEQLCDYRYIPRRKGWRICGIFIKKRSSE